MYSGHTDRIFILSQSAGTLVDRDVDSGECGFDLNRIRIDRVIHQYYFSFRHIMLGLGLMIDNGIIVLDNIYQEHQQHGDAANACIRGTNEMIRPLLASMLTTCSVFLPLVFLSGISGALFMDQAVSVSLGLVISYLVSITLLPTLYFLIVQKKVPQYALSGIQKWYHHSMDRILRKPAVILIPGMLFVLAGIFIVRNISLARFPELPKEALECLISWNENIDPKIAEFRLAQMMDEINDTLSYDVHIGQDQYVFNHIPETGIFGAHLYIHLPRASGISHQHISQSLQKYFQEIHPQAVIDIIPARTIFDIIFPSEPEKMTAEFYFPPLPEDLLKDRLARWKANLESQFPDLQADSGYYEQTLFISPRQDRLFFYDIQPAQVINELSAQVNFTHLLDLESFQQKIPVVMKGKSTTLFPQILDEVRVTNRKGTAIRLSELLEWEYRSAPKKIFGSRLGTYHPISMQVQDQQDVIRYLNRASKQHPDTKILIKSSVLENQKLIRELSWVLFAALLLLYFIMVAQFESFWQPLIILLEIPVSLAGALLLLWIFGISLNLMAMIGMVVTVGIIINDSIIKIDTINRLRRSGIPSRQAILDGGLKRFNPILMTSFTTVLAVIPIFFYDDLGSVLQQSLAVSLIGGMIVGTLVSIYLIPALYYLVVGRKEKGN